MKKLVLLFSGIFLFTGISFSQTYVGPERCLTCHPTKTGWRTSLHANGYSVVLDDSRSLEDKFGVVNDYDQNGVDDFHDGLDFNTISSVFDPYKPNAPILSYNNGYYITIGEVTNRVYLTYGGSGLWKQRYMVKINTSQGESADHYISPVQYNDKTFGYAAYHPETWWDANNDPIYTNSSVKSDAAQFGKSLAAGCSGCHSTGNQVNPKDANGEWTYSAGGVDDESMYTTFNNIYDIDGDGDLDQINTGCESCHGPGGDHASAPSTSNIINPETDLTPEQSNNTCGMCHNRGKSLPNNSFGFPYDDQNLTPWAVGDLVADFFTDGGGDWADNKTSKKHRQQFLDFYESSKPTFQFEKVTCSDCHDVHNTEKHNIRTEVEEEDSVGNPIIIATENDNNTLCLSCHATHGDFADISKEMVADYQNNITEIGNIVSLHTNHPYDPTGNGSSRCSKCHMPKTAKSAVNYDIHSHTFEPIAPEKTKIFEMPNTCASCHMQDGYPNFGIDFTNDNIGDWTEATDIALADTLMHWYGPGGIWWVNVVSVEVENSEIPETYALSQNYPNPFNPSTQINFSVPEPSMVKITVYDVTGREVEVLVREYLDAGNYKTNWNAENYSSGIYFYRMETNSFAQVKKMILMK
jgi:Secretion system C-terminal sorting domain